MSFLHEHQGYAAFCFRVSSTTFGYSSPAPQTAYISRLYISVVTLGEMEYGHQANPSADPGKQAAFESFVRTSCPVSWPITADVARHYGQLRAWLLDTCGPRGSRTKVKRAEQLVNPVTGVELGIQENDLWIAAQALTHNFALVTHDHRGNFGKLLNQFAAGLNVEDWAEGQEMRER